MAYFDTATLARDADFKSRIAACWAIEQGGVFGEGTGLPDPESWAAMNAWAVAAQPGLGDSYAYALAQSPPNPSPGKDPTVITDETLLAAVSVVMGGSGA